MKVAIRQHVTAWYDTILVGEEIYKLEGEERTCVIDSPPYEEDGFLCYRIFFADDETSGSVRWHKEKGCFEAYVRLIP